MSPYQILVLSSGVWWSLLLDKCCLWRHNIFTLANQRFGEGCWHNMPIILHALSLLVVVQCVAVMNIYQRSKLGDRSKTRGALNATKEQFITAKYPATRYNRGVEHTECYVSAVHNQSSLWGSQMRNTTKQFARCYLILAHFQRCKFNTVYIHRIDLLTLGTLHSLCVCMVAQLHALRVRQNKHLLIVEFS